jgi:hypothetical protein
LEVDNLRLWRGIAGNEPIRQRNPRQDRILIRFLLEVIFGCWCDRAFTDCCLSFDTGGILNDVCSRLEQLQKLTSCSF